MSESQHYPKDLIGQTFGRLTVLSRHPSQVKNTTGWECRCACGEISVVRRTNLVSGHARSCGCLQRESRYVGNLKHRLSKTLEWGIYYKMRDRCEKPSDRAYRNYGARGITVCGRWKESVENFVADMGTRPAGFTLDRIDNNAGYSPGNCRWADRRTQGRNRRGNVVLAHNGKTQTMADWADEVGMKYSILQRRIKRGWPIEDALTVPRCKSKYWRTTRNS